MNVSTEKQEFTLATVFSSDFTPIETDRTSESCVHNLISGHQADKN